MVSPKQKATNKKNTTWGLVAAFIVLVGMFLFLRSPYFDVTEFLISGITNVTQEDVLARVSQIQKNIFAFDLKLAERHIEASPWVQKATCTRKFPDTVVIAVTERTPLFFAPMENGTWLLDGKGRVLGEDDGKWRGLVALTGVVGQASSGQFLDSSQYGWAFKISASLGDMSRERLAEINVQDRECTLILDDECKVYMGKESLEPARLGLLLESILEDIAEEGIMAEHIDLRFDKPVVRYSSKAGG